MASDASPTSDLIQNVLSEETGQSSFACQHCRRQKVRCSRDLPACSACVKASRTCNYPLTVQKPGPKAGTHRRPRASLPTSRGEQSDSYDGTTKRAKVDEDPSNLRVRKSTTYRGRYDAFRHASEDLRRGSKSVSTTSQSPRTTTKLDNPVLRLVHPNHDPAGDISTPEHASPGSHGDFTYRFEIVCQGLGCSSEQGWELIKVYFMNMSAFSLFHRPTFEHKLSDILPRKHLQALLSAMFSYALRYKESIPMVKDTALSAKAMLDLSTKLQHECVAECHDDDPPLHLLQSLYLVTFQKLIHGARGKTWRMLGDCIRMAYELRLHLVDSDAAKSDPEDDTPQTEADSWVKGEEKRRMWWALWEMDVFTSTIRRLPSAIDERLNFTLLPATDDDWFNGVESPSCFLAPDASRRWRNIADCGNKSPQTWFILVNSYMFDAHKMGSFPEVWAKRIGFQPDGDVEQYDSAQLVALMRDHIDNCLHCAFQSLPRELSWQDRFLAFKPLVSSSKASFRALDSARYAIGVMFQLARIMLCVWEVHQVSAASLPQTRVNTPPQQTEESANLAHDEASNNSVKLDQRVWDRYINAANYTAEIIRNSSLQHYQFVTPLICNALWYAAASLVVAKLFGPPSFNSKLASSNFDLLVATLNKLETFWQTPSVLKHKLKNLEANLNRMRSKPTLGGVSLNTSEPPASPTHSKPHSISQDVISAAPQNEVGYSVGNGIDNLTSAYAAPPTQDWLSQGIFDFDAIPAFGMGQPEMLQPLPYGNIPNNNFHGVLPNDGYNFNDLFMYPYQ